jgi:uncharacterized protein YndB with AHSA1/START domain
VWTTSRQIAAPADAVWQLLVDLDAWPQWGPTVAGAELDGAGFELGATGRVWTPVGVPLPFTVTELDQGRTWAWSVAGVPATRHGVEPSGDGCRAWMSAPIWAPAYLPVLAVALRRIESMARLGDSSGG